MENCKYILIDFDGTCIPQASEEHVAEDLSNIDIGAVPILRKLSERGHKLILWTLRNSNLNNPYNNNSQGKDSLKVAINWFERNNIPLFGINDNPFTEKLVGTSRKIYGDLLIDDTALGVPLRHRVFQTKEGESYVVHFVNWDLIEEYLIDRKFL